MSDLLVKEPKSNFWKTLEMPLTLSCILMKSAQTYLKILRWEHRKILKVWLTHFLSLCLRGLMNDKIELILEKVVGCVTAYCLMLTQNWQNN